MDTLIESELSITVCIVKSTNERPNWRVKGLGYRVIEGTVDQDYRLIEDTVDQSYRLIGDTVDQHIDYR